MLVVSVLGQETGFGSSPRVAGVGPGLFAVLFIGAVFLVACCVSWYSRHRMAVVGGTLVLYTLLILFFIVAPKKEPGAPSDDSPADWSVGWRVLMCLVLFSSCCVCSLVILSDDVMKPRYAIPKD